jgi:hypothetical protein
MRMLKKGMEDEGVEKVLLKKRIEIGWIWEDITTEEYDEYNA